MTENSVVGKLMSVLMFVLTAIDSFLWTSPALFVKHMAITFRPNKHIHR